MIKRFFEWGNQDISFGDFIRLAFDTALEEMTRVLLYLHPILTIGLDGLLVEQSGAQAQRRRNQAAYEEMMKLIPQTVTMRSIADFV